ncbi:MAG: tyrosine-protein phosphatase [Pseudomonadota bacterium]
MFSKISKGLSDWERGIRYSFGRDIKDPAERRKSTFHYNFFDHAFLRAKWTNFFEISEGVYRSNQPTHARFLKYKDLGIRAVINLRGTDPYAHYLFEEESCDILGLKLYNCRLWARRAAERENIVEVIDLMRVIERPFMFHCKSGADRAGFCAAMYQMIFDDVPVQEARKQLGIKFIHLKWSKTGILDYTLDVYEARLARGQIGFEDWIRREYDHEVIQQGFDSKTPPAQIA